MESNWRWNRELFGMGGKIFETFFVGEQLDFLAVLNPPLLLPSGVATHIAICPRTTGGRRVVFGRLLTGNFIPIQSTVIGNHDPWYLNYPVDPD